jgi:hypothetical protein
MNIRALSQNSNAGEEENGPTAKWWETQGFMLHNTIHIICVAYYHLHDIIIY